MDSQSTPPQQQDQEPVHDGAEAQNAVACAPPPPPPPPPFTHSRLSSASASDDVKRTDAASLARQLATSSSWSDTFMPRSYGTTNTNPVHPYPPVRIEEQGNMYPQDPPPRYTRNPEIHELPAESLRDSPSEEIITPTVPITTSTSLPNMPVAANSSEQELVEPPQEVITEQSNITQDLESTAETPLLENIVTRSVRPVRGWWARRRAERMKKRRRFKIICFSFILLFFLTAFILSLCIGLRKDNTWFNHPSAPSVTFVPTGRVYELHRAVGDIDGRFKLYDRLDLSTATGSIDIEIDPQEGDLPAVLALSSNLGSITLRVSQAYLRRRRRAQRVFQTTISSLAGTVTAEILIGHGGSALVDTTFGSQSLSIIGQGLGPMDEISNLTTLSRTGVQRIIVTSINPASIPVAHLHSQHKVFGAASMDINYPSNWQGEVQAVAAPVGNLVVEGDGLEYRSGSDLEVVARRRYSNVTTTVQIVNEGTGDIVFRC